MRLNRRRFIAGTGLAAVGIGIGGNVLADGHELPVEIVEVNVEDEYVVLENTGDSDIGLSGYVIDWEYQDSDPQTNNIPDGTTISVGEQLTISTGYADYKGDVDFGYDAAQINNDGSDVIALLTSDGEVVARSDDDAGDRQDGNDTDNDPGDGEDDTDDEDDSAADDTEDAGNSNNEADNTNDGTEESAVDDSATDDTEDAGDSNNEADNTNDGTEESAVDDSAADNC